MVLSFYYFLWKIWSLFERSWNRNCGVYYFWFFVFKSQPSKWQRRKYRHGSLRYSKILDYYKNYKCNILDFDLLWLFLSANSRRNNGFFYNDIYFKNNQIEVW